MKNVTISLLFLVLCTLTVWCEESKEKVKAGHDEMIKSCGDAKFLTGEHHYLTTLLISPATEKQIGWISWTSVYTVPNEFCVYRETGKQKSYILVSLIKEKENVQMVFTNKLVKESVSQTIQ